MKGYASGDRGVTAFSPKFPPNCSLLVWFITSLLKDTSYLITALAELTSIDGVTPSWDTMLGDIS